MSVDTKHPLYEENLPDWELLLDSYKGERLIKSKTSLYLPPTSGMLADGMGAMQPGNMAYTAYITRAVFPEFLQESVSTCMGMLWYKDPIIKLPKQLEPLLKRASVKGETLHQLLRRVHEQQLTTGRVGLLLDLPRDVPSDVPPLPYLALYDSKSMINWDDGRRDSPVLQSLNLVVLDESENVRTRDFEWEFVNKYRVLTLGAELTNEVSGSYSARVVSVSDHKETEVVALVQPNIRGTGLNEIPFVFINSKDLLPDPDVPPMLPLARLCMTIYRGEADYRQTLFMQSQDTLVIIGGTEDEGAQVRVGANATLHLPNGADAKFVGVEGKGLTEQRLALENDRRLAASRSGQLVDTTSRQRESGDALQTRVAAQTATLADVAITAAGGLLRILQIAAKWVGANPDEVEVTPNMDFVNAQMTTRNLVELTTAKTLGAPISQASIHAIAKQRRLTEMTYEEELAAIKKEPTLVEEPSQSQAGGQGGSGRGAAGV